jgi:hypothetical protein
MKDLWWPALKHNQTSIVSLWEQNAHQYQAQKPDTPAFTQRKTFLPACKIIYYEYSLLYICRNKFVSCSYLYYMAGDVKILIEFFSLQNLLFQLYNVKSNVWPKQLYFKSIQFCLYNQAKQTKPLKIICFYLCIIWGLCTFTIWKAWILIC